MSESGEIVPPIPFGDSVVVSKLLETFHKTCVTDVLLVLDPQVAEFSNSGQKGTRVVFNYGLKCHKASYVRSGVAALKPDCDAFFLSSIATPLIRRTTIEDLLQNHGCSGRGAVIPSFQGRKGFPVLVSANLMDKIVNWNGLSDLRDYLGQDDFDPLEIEVADENILDDAGLIEGKLAWADRLDNYDIPSSRECHALLTGKLGVDPELLAHSQAVANVALKLGRALNRRGHRLNLRLIEAAGLLHDMAKGKRNHAAIAAGFLRNMDFARVAEIVGAHMDPIVSLEEPVNERDVVCFADKLVQKDRVVPLDVRFQQQLERYGDDPERKAAIEKRMSDAKALKNRFEVALGESIERVVSEVEA